MKSQTQSDSRKPRATQRTGYPGSLGLELKNPGIGGTQSAGSTWASWETRMQSHQMSATGRYIILIAAFLGWMCSGVQMTLTRLAAGSATEEFGRSGWLSDGAAI